MAACKLDEITTKLEVIKYEKNYLLGLNLCDTIKQVLL